jgi:hypothetical protein
MSLRHGLLGVAAALLISVATTRATAQGAERAYGEALEDAAVILIPLFLLPSSAGPELALPKNEASDLRLILGWPFQIPLPFGSRPTFSHRVALAPELALGARDHAVFRGRVGYRYGGSWFLVGAGLLVDKTGAFVSPELGVRYPEAKDDEFSFGGVLILRSDVATRDGAIRLSAQIGWVLL